MSRRISTLGMTFRLWNQRERDKLDEVLREIDKNPAVPSFAFLMKEPDEVKRTVVYTLTDPDILTSADGRNTGLDVSINLRFHEYKVITYGGIVYPDCPILGEDLHTNFRGILNDEKVS